MMSYKLTLKGARSERTRWMNKARNGKGKISVALLHTWVQNARRANRRVVRLLNGTAIT